MKVALADLSDSQVIALITYHQQQMVAGSPPGHSFALDLSGLRAEGVTVWAVHREGVVAAIGALHRFDKNLGEIKSMRTHPEHLRQGCAAALLDTIIAHARATGLTRLSLETGSGDAFEPALALYRSRGFENGPAFADYTLSPFNQCLHLSID